MHNLKAHLFTTLTLAISIILFAIIVASIHQAGLINSSSYQITINIVSFIAFFIGGLVLGFKVKKHGFLHALIFALGYCLIMFLTMFLAGNKGFSQTDIIFVGIKAATLIIGTVVGRNLKGH